MNLDIGTSTVILQLAHHQIYYLGKVGRKLRGISGREAVEAFKKFGYSERKGKGSHVNLVKPESNRLTIPLHTELSVGLLLNEIKKAGLTVEEFLQLLGRR